MGNSSSTEEVWFYLVSEGKKKPYKKMGPFRFEAIAQLYKEESIDEETILWTNAKFTDPENKKKIVYMEEWKKMKDMPMEFHSRLNQTVNNVSDRRTQPSAVSYTQTVSGYQGHGPTLPSY